MKRLLNILVFLALSLAICAQEDTRIVDSLQNVLPSQSGRDKVLTMIELTWEFHDISYDDCLNWGEKAIQEAHSQGLADLEAKANYVLGIQYAHHAEMDLAKEFLQNAYDQFSALNDQKNVFEALWSIAIYEMTYGNIDTAYHVYEKALPIAEAINDTSACAHVVANIAAIWYKKDEKRKAFDYFREAKRWFEAIDDERSILRMEANMATIQYEQGHPDEARHVYWRIMPRFEAFGDNHFLFLTCKNLGLIYENLLVDYDSAMFYFQKAIACTDNPVLYKANDVFLNNEKSGAFVEIANIMERQGDHAAAIANYEEALAVAQNSGYLFGQMEACVGLGKIFSKLGQAAKSMQYFNRYFEIEKKSGLGYLRPSFRKALSIDYARLGRYDDLSDELSVFETDNADLARENNGLYEENGRLQEELSGLLIQHDAQIAQIETLQSQRNQYRLAFFGLLALAIAAVALFIANKIVRKNRAKIRND